MIHVEFNNNIPLIDAWSSRLGVHLTPESVTEPYRRARPYLMGIASRLLDTGRFNPRPTSKDSRLLWSLECPQPLPIQTRNGFSITPAAVIELPKNASSFWSPDRRVQWEMVFHSAVWPAMRNTCAPLNDLLSLLQCLLPGMIVLAQTEDGMKTVRGLPSHHWLEHWQPMLIDIFGYEHYERLYVAAQNIQLSYMAGPVPRDWRAWW
ncbi:hypothetical protein M422DRAFT_191709 [Sphaerobolus stellatus SS14]|uniref:Uncharacterized protein n=1 Tax=Sphaerobolus stellatus (strain SS14) TaxID=990650 RepID=A0A0C9UCH9_SPHS4|nr:hypothetical protein M422DRAFT_191709 [Sphaerobolus stellatus SS14]